MDIFKPAWLSENRSRRKKAIERAIKKGDQKTLYRIATEIEWSPDSVILHAIRDDRKLFEIGLAKPSVLGKVLTLISDPAVLKETLKSEAVDIYERFEICEKLKSSVSADSEMETIDAVMEETAMEILLAAWSSPPSCIHALRSQELLVRVIAETKCIRSAVCAARELSLDRRLEGLLKRIAANRDDIDEFLEECLSDFTQAQCEEILRAISANPQLKDRSAIAALLLPRIRNADNLFAATAGLGVPDAVFAALEALGADDDEMLTKFAAVSVENAEAVVARYPYSKRMPLYQQWDSGNFEHLRRAAQREARLAEIKSTTSVKRLFEMWDECGDKQINVCESSALMERLEKLAQGSDAAEISREAMQRIHIDSSMRYDQAQDKYETLLKFVWLSTHQGAWTTLMLIGGETLLNGAISRLTDDRCEDSHADLDIKFLFNVYRDYPEYRAKIAQLEGRALQLHEDLET